MTPAERLRKHQRALEKTQRELDRERVKLENQEKKLVQDIKKSAKNGQIGACKIQAKDLVRTRRYAEITCAFVYIPFMCYLGNSLLIFFLLLSPSTIDTSKSSTRCEHSYKPSPSGSRYGKSLQLETPDQETPIYLLPIFC